MDPETPRVAAAEARREAMLNAARQVFFEAGYPLASMDRIAEVAGVTKRTVYAHFASKDALFAAVVARGCANVAAQLSTLEPTGSDPHEGLLSMLRRARELVRSPNCLRLERIVAAEAERHPEFAQTLCAAFAEGEALLQRALDRWVAAGRLKPHDTAATARMLQDQVSWATSLRGILEAPDDALADAALVQMVAGLLAVHGADAKGAGAS